MALLSNIELLSYQDKIDSLLFPGVFKDMNDRELLSNTVVFILMNTRTGKTVAETGDEVTTASRKASQTGEASRGPQEEERGRTSAQSRDNTGGEHDIHETIDSHDPNDRVIEDGSCRTRRNSNGRRHRLKRFIYKTSDSLKKAFKKEQPIDAALIE